MKIIISILAGITGLLSSIFLILNFDNVNKEYTYIKELEFKIDNMDKYYQNGIDSLYQLQIEHKKLQEQYKQSLENIDLTNKECLRLRKQNIQYRLQLK